jgi:hypothetical protein
LIATIFCNVNCKVQSKIYEIDKNENDSGNDQDQEVIIEFQNIYWANDDATLIAGELFKLLLTLFYFEFEGNLKKNQKLN